MISGVGRSVVLSLNSLSSAQDGSIHGWIAPGVFGEAPVNWSALRAHVKNDIQQVEMNMQIFVEDTTTTQVGHIAGLNAEGHLQGWSAKPESGTHELPVQVSVGDRHVLAFTTGRWASESYRSFSVPLDALVQGSGVHKLGITGGCSAPAPFGRKDSFVLRTAAGLIHGAPLQIKANVLTGAFQIAADQDAVVTVALRNGAYQSDTFLCDQPVSYNFNGKSCGFSLPLLPSDMINPTVCEIVLGQIPGDDLGSFALTDFLCDLD